MSKLNIIGVSASSQYNTSFNPEFAIDGDMSTRWASLNKSGTQYIQFDLGGNYTIESIKAACGSTYQPETFDLQISEDGTTFITHQENLTINTTDTLQEFTFTEIETRHIRLLMKSTKSPNFYELKEFEVYGREFVPKSLVGIELITQPFKLSYEIGESLNLSGIKINGNYDNNTTEEIPIDNSMASGFNSSTVVSGQKITITIEEFTVSFLVDIKQTPIPGPSHSSLLEKINKQNQTIYENANPKMSVVVARAKSSVRDNTYFTIEKIRQKAGITDIAVAARRLSNYGPPDRLYNIWLDNGLVRTGHREYPDKLKAGWQNDFDIENGKAVSIVFDGRWELNKYKTWGKRTSELPWLFWVDTNNILKCQLWNLGTEFQLATGVVKIDSLRGWVPAQAGHIDDQGVIIAYIKSDGKVYYRNYCIQETEGLTIWESERQVTELGTGNLGVRLFRTNDFRLGIIGEKIAGNIMVITDRNWAGMSIAPESIVGKVSVDLDLIRIEEITGTHVENIKGETEISEMELCHIDTPEPKCIKATKLGLNKIILEFALDIISSTITDDLIEYNFTIDNGDSIIQSIEVGDNAREIIITLEENIDISLDIEISYFNLPTGLRTYADDYCKRLVDSFDLTAEGNPPFGYHQESIKGEITVELELNYVDFKETYMQESLKGEVTVEINLWDVDDAPV